MVLSEETLQSLVEGVTSSVNFDRWGQVIEAIESYEKLLVLLKRCNYIDNTSQANLRIDNMCSLLKKRVAFLKNPGSEEYVVLDDITLLVKDIELLGKSKSLRSCSYTSTSRSGSAGSLMVPDMSNSSLLVHATRSASNCGLNTKKPGFTYVTIFLDKIGVKECTTLLDCYITMYTKSGTGEDLAPIQDTAITNNKSTPYLIFSYNLNVTIPLEEFPKDGAIFFELNHFKPKKITSSCKCFTFMELDEITEGAAALELYKKPADFKRKRLTLLTTKNLYLHLKVKIDKFVEPPKQP